MCFHAATAGQRVLTGSLLLVCEVMKCECPINAPTNGELLWIRACGEVIEAEDVVAILETS